VLVDATLGRRGTRERCWRPIRASRSSAGHGPGRDRGIPAAAEPLRRQGHARARALRRDGRDSGGHRPAAGAGVLFDLGVLCRSSTTRPAASPTRMTRRWTCAWTAPRAHRGAGREHYPGRAAGRCAARVRRGAVRGRIARALGARTRSRTLSHRQLTDVIRASIPAPARRTGGNPAKRTFQALRIE